MKLLITVLIVFLTTTIFYPQDVPFVRGHVVYTLENNVEEPQIGVTVLVEETGDRDKTDQNGMFKIFLNKKYKPGDRVTFRVEKNNWVIRDPLFGKTFIPSDTKSEFIKLHILPKGSPLFFTDPQIKKYIEFLVLKKNSEKEESIVDNKKLSIETLSDTMANKWGFVAKWVVSAILEWASKKLVDNSDLRDLGLAEYTQKNFSKAGDLFIQSADNKIENFQEVEKNIKNLTQEKRSIISEIIKDLEFAGESYNEVNKYDSSLYAYKTATTFLEYSEDWEQLVSTLNKVGICYYNLSFESNAKKFFENLDSALIYFNRGMRLSEERSLEDWKWKFKGNIATTSLEQEIYSNNSSKVSSLLKLKGVLNEVKGNREQDLYSKDKFMSLNNLGVCFNGLYEFSDSIDASLKYLDSSIISYNNVIIDSTVKRNYPIEWASVNYNLARALTEKVKNDYNLPSIYQCLIFEMLKATKSDFEEGIINRSYINNIMSINPFEEIENKYKNAEAVFIQEDKPKELISVRNGLLFISIQNILLFPEYFNNEYIDTSYAIAKINLLNASKIHFIQDEIDSRLYQFIFEVIFGLKNKKNIDETVNNQIQLLEKKLIKEPILEFNIASIKRVLLTLYFYKYLSNKGNEKVSPIIEHIKEFNNDIIITFSNIGYKREKEDAMKLREMINFIE